MQATHFFHVIQLFLDFCGENPVRLLGMIAFPMAWQPFVTDVPLSYHYIKKLLLSLISPRTLF
jgi:hypothetical protein